MAQLMDHTGSLIKALTMIAITLMLIWFGLRPAMKMLLEARTDATGQNPQLPNDVSRARHTPRPPPPAKLPGSSSRPTSSPT